MTSGTRFFRSLFPRTSAVCAIRKIIGKKSHSASECLIEEHFLDIIQAQVARMRLGYGMKRTWDIEELIEYFTLVPPELELLGNKTGATRLNFALLLKCFQREDIA
jgi:hypothetical protein